MKLYFISMVIENCKFYDNYTPYDGGVFYVFVPYQFSVNNIEAHNSTAIERVIYIYLYIHNIYHNVLILYCIILYLLLLLFLFFHFIF